MVAETRKTAVPQARALGEGEARAIEGLATGMRKYFEAIVSPHWECVTAAVNADQSLRASTMLRGGVAALLDTLHPSVRFRDGMLIITDYQGERDLYLDGRGLLLVPSFFKDRTKPITLLDPELVPVLVYQVDRAAGILAGDLQEPLAALLGRTRARALELCRVGGTTTSIAKELKMSISSISEHLTVLRGARLILSDRQRNTVVHTLSPLGRAFLDGRPMLDPDYEAASPSNACGRI